MGHKQFERCSNCEIRTEYLTLPKQHFSIEYIVCVFQSDTGKGTSEKTQNAQFILKGRTICNF